MTSGGSQQPILRAYVDETGDRGMLGKSSPFFAFAAVLVADEDEPPLRNAMAKLRADLGVPAQKALHWAEHAKKYSRRQHITTTLTKVGGLQIVYVFVDKAAIPASAIMNTDQAKFYNFAAGMVLERVLLAARDWAGGPRQAVVRFGHVRGFQHATTTAYFNHRIATNNPPFVPWHLLSSAVRFEDQVAWDGLQVADQYAGMLHAAFRPDEFGNYEPQHFLMAQPQIRQVGGVVWGRGFKLLGHQASIKALPWWHLTGL